MDIGSSEGLGTSEGRVEVLRPFLLLLVFAAGLAGCTTLGLQGGPSTVSVDRSWFAVNDAFADEGLLVTREDREAGLLEGQLDGIVVNARVGAQDDGSVRVDFRASGERHRDPGLLQRVVRAYDRHMGR